MTSHTALTARYRPQTFAEVAGQETVKTILSRASAEGRVAPAYLFSGTRGVGKTTLARIFAKALNCRNAPVAEPCNSCDLCRGITAGGAVDVVEIDGASNRGIDDVRRLKEVVGYAPMEGGYKIFIIDEAHMLSREAFNALLKTLEEPPARVTFILATTEPHKFPATILSRCQHYVFKRLSENGLTDHLAKVLRNEAVSFEESAVRLLARRGAGSVRDSMSLLGQVLALGQDGLTEDSVRQVLGLAGQEIFVRLLEACRDGNSVELSRLLRELLDQGLDLGFFLRELAQLWRSLFMLRQAGEEALPVVELPEAEARQYLALSRDFSLSHIHACWQMTLEGQRRVLTSLEPALALELLLLNLSMLPRLLSLESLSVLGRKGAPGKGSGNTPGGTASFSQSSAARNGRENEGPAKKGTSGQEAGSPSQEADPGQYGRFPGAQGANKAVGPQTSGQGEQQPVLSGPSGVAQEKTPVDPHAVQEARPVDKRQENAYFPSMPVGDTGAAGPVPAGGFEQIPAAFAGGYVSGQKPRSAPVQENACSGAPSDFDKNGLTERPEFLPDPASGEPLPDSGMSGSSMGKEQGHQAAGPGPVLPDSPASTTKAEENGTRPAANAEATFRRPDWETLFSLFTIEEAHPSWLSALLRRVTAEWRENSLVLTAQDNLTAEHLRDPQRREPLERLLRQWCGFVPAIELVVVEKQRKTRDELRAELLEHPLVKEVERQFGAHILDFGNIV